MSRRSTVLPVPGGPLTASSGRSASASMAALTASCWFSTSGWRPRPGQRTGGNRRGSVNRRAAFRLSGSWLLAPERYLRGRRDGLQVATEGGWSVPVEKQAARGDEVVDEETVQQERLRRWRRLCPCRDSRYRTPAVRPASGRPPAAQAATRTRGRGWARPVASARPRDRFAPGGHAAPFCSARRARVHPSRRSSCPRRAIGRAQAKHETEAWARTAGTPRPFHRQGGEMASPSATGRFRSLVAVGHDQAVEGLLHADRAEHDLVEARRLLVAGVGVHPRRTVDVGVKNPPPAELELGAVAEGLRRQRLDGHPCGQDVDGMVRHDERSRRLASSRGGRRHGGSAGTPTGAETISDGAAGGRARRAGLMSTGHPCERGTQRGLALPGGIHDLRKTGVRPPLR